MVRPLIAVRRYVWTSFLRDRLVGKGALTGGMEASGWRLVYKDEPNAHAKASSRGGADYTYSLGLSLNKDGVIGDVRWDSPAFKAGIGSGSTVVAVNGLAYDKDVLDEAVTAAKTGAPIELMLRDFDVYRTIKLDYRGGLRYPHLERIPGRADWLGRILAAR